jgi:hypothetical protein
VSPAQIAAAVAAVLLAAFAVWRRRSLSGERKLLAAAAVLALAIYASGVLSELPDPKKVIGDVAGALGPWTYALVGVMAYLETGPPASTSGAGSAGASWSATARA